MSEIDRSPLLEHDHDHHLPVERLCIDDMLSKYCGDFGRWQLKHFILTSSAWALDALHTMVLIFADREPAWRCTTSACSSKSVCHLEPGSWEWIGGLGSSTVSEFGLICSDKYKVGLVQALFFGGCMIGAGVFGHLSDSSLGRKGSLIVVCVLNTIFGCLTSLVPNYNSYAALRFLTGISAGGVSLCAFVLATEPVGPAMRGLAGMSTFYFFSGGIAALSAIAYVFASSWRSLYVATSLPSLIFLVAILPFISESPRWLLIRGKTDRAMKIMREIAEANKKHLPENVTLTLNDGGRQQEIELAAMRRRGGGEGGGGSLVDVLRCPLTRGRLLLAIAINLLCSIVYYGLNLNVANLGPNLHLNVFINAVAEMPAFLLTALLLDRFGRRPLDIGTQWFSGLFCLVGICLATHKGFWRMACSVLGIFGMSATYNLLFIYTVELFPTVVRNAALASTAQATQVGAILAPVIVLLGERLSFGVFGLCGILGGVLAFFLPETLNKPLYDTMAGMEVGESGLA